MIDDIVEMVLKEARGREGLDPVGRIYTVLKEVDHKIIQIMDNIREEERRKKEDESKG